MNKKHCESSALFLYPKRPFSFCYGFLPEDTRVCADLFFEFPCKMLSRPKAAAQCDLLDRKLGEFKEFFRYLQSVMPQILYRCHTQLTFKQLGQRRVIERCRFYYALESDAVAVVVLDINDRLLQMQIYYSVGCVYRGALSEEHVRSL